jgi:hypothetical protein
MQSTSQLVVSPRTLGAITDTMSVLLTLCVHNSSSIVLEYLCPPCDFLRRYTLHGHWSSVLNCPVCCCAVPRPLCIMCGRWSTFGGSWKFCGRCPLMPREKITLVIEPVRGPWSCDMCMGGRRHIAEFGGAKLICPFCKGMSSLMIDTLVPRVESPVSITRSLHYTI